ncbi:unnamed protein product, partial [Iphiclides podalirius]
MSAGLTFMCRSGEEGLPLIAPAHVTHSQHSRARARACALRDPGDRDCRTPAPTSPRGPHRYRLPHFSL